MFPPNALLLLAALIGIAQATTYAQFCDDTGCSQNCGESVSTDNPGCLNESGRHSIKFHDTNAQQVQLVFSPQANCNCQSACTTVVKCVDSNVGNLPLPLCGGPIGGCMDLSGYPDSQSFRFQGDDCASNNC